MLGFAKLLTGDVVPVMGDGSQLPDFLPWDLHGDLLGWRFFDPANKERTAEDWLAVQRLCPPKNMIPEGHKTAEETAADGRLAVLYDVTCRFKRLIADELARGLVPPGTPIPMEESEVKQYQSFYPILRSQPAKRPPKPAQEGAQAPPSKRSQKRRRQAARRKEGTAAAVPKPEAPAGAARVEK